MKNIIYVIVIFFWILSLLSKSKRQKQQAAEREQMKKLAGQRTRTEPKPVRYSSEVTPQNEPIVDYESAYGSSDYVNPETSSISQGGLYLQNTLGTESREEKEAYDNDKQIIPSLSLSNTAMKQYVIASEILGKPKALRNR